MTAAADRVTDELIELNGLRFHFRDWASDRPDAPVLMLVHGLAWHSRSWDTTARAFTSTYRVLAVDQRGHGESAWSPTADYRAATLAGDLAAFIAAMRLSNVTLVGHSLGGRASIIYAGARPAELARLVIVDMGIEGNPAGRARILGNVAANDVFDDRQAQIDQRFVVLPNGDPDENRHLAIHNGMRLADGTWTWRWDRALRAEGGAEQLALDPEEGWRLWKNIGVPTLLIRGADSDILSKDVAVRMAETVPDGRLVEVAGSGHSIPVERPAALIEALRTFL